MTYPIDPTIPAASNDPADDQPLMQQNFANINSYLQVDHTNPAATGAGLHEQVTFFTTQTPSIPTTPTSILFTSSVDGLGNTLPNSNSQLLFYTGNTPRSQNQYYVGVSSKPDVDGTECSTLVMCGIIIKFGVINNPPNSSSLALTFVKQFPNNCYSVQVTPDYTSTSTIRSATVSNVSQTGFTLYTTSGSFNAVYWVAIGN